MPSRYLTAVVILVGLFGILITVAGHALVSAWLITKAPRFIRPFLDRVGPGGRTIVLALSACLLAIKHAADITFWAWVFELCAGDQFGDFEATLYFSSVTYTSLGYGDAVVTGPWRLLTGFEAISGMLMFGLSTALLFAFIQTTWLEEQMQRYRETIKERNSD